jgi:hypothetical protein
MTKRVLLAAAFCAAALTTGAGAAHAQACGQPDEVPAELFDTYVELLAAWFPLDEAQCDKLAKDALATCRRAVSAEAGCWAQLVKGVTKGGKVACKAQGPDEDECNAAVFAEIGGAEVAIEASELEGHVACEAEAASFRSFCLNPF